MSDDLEPVDWHAAYIESEARTTEALRHVIRLELEIDALRKRLPVERPDKFESDADALDYLYHSHWTLPKDRHGKEDTKEESDGTCGQGVEPCC